MQTAARNHHQTRILWAWQRRQLSPVCWARRCLVSPATLEQLFALVAGAYRIAGVAFAGSLGRRPVEADYFPFSLGVALACWKDY